MYEPDVTKEQGSSNPIGDYGFIGDIRVCLSLTARPADYGISISGADTEGSPLHWAFTDICDDSFEWVGRTMSGRDEWWVEQTMSGRRRG